MTFRTAQLDRCTGFPSNRSLTVAARFGRALTLLLVGMVIVAAVGCAPRSTRFYVDDHRPDAPAKRYYEEFPECYYSMDAHKGVDIVARREIPSDDGDGQIVQVIHIRRVWAAVPGRTYVEESMINSTVSYMIVDPNGATSFEGGGFVTFRENRSETQIAGKLESSALTPQRAIGQGGELFDRVSVTGTFRATHDKHQAIRILNEMKRLLGPLPSYQPPPVNPDLR